MFPAPMIVTFILALLTAPKLTHKVNIVNIVPEPFRAYSATYVRCGMRTSENSSSTPFVNRHTA
jgi:hypothetical protein